MDGDDATAQQGGTTGSDGERRLALALAQRLRDGGREARVQAFWVRPAWWLVQALCAAAGIVASVLAVGDAAAGLLVAAAALVLAVADVTRHPLLRRLTVARATQTVVSPPIARPGERPVTLIVTAAVDRPRQGLQRRLGAPLIALSFLSLALVAGCAAGRLAGAGRWIGVVQLVPTVVLLVALTGFLDQGLADPAADDRAPEAAVDLARALDADPPRNLEVAVVLAGAGAALGAGLRRWLDSRRARGLRAQDVAILHLEAWPAAGEDILWWRRDGIVLAAALHPQLRAAATAASGTRTPPGARVRSAPDATGAGAARAAGWPAVAVAVGEDRDACRAFLLELVHHLDGGLDSGAPPLHHVESGAEPL
ncbi:MAG TPA: hypothetical protein VII98_11165 [Solirubrobacteraceae bacterium]